jgi:hypothetical protein
MKKLLLSLSMVAFLGLAAQAQEPVKTKTTKKEVVNADGTTTVVEEKSTTTNEPSKNPEPKKSGTRMAINEKGSGSTKVAPKKEAAKESKTENQTTPTSKPQ